MSNILRTLRKRHPLNDPTKWSAEMRPPYFDALSYQMRLDERVGRNREGKSILRLVWAPESIGLYGIPRYWVSRVKDGEDWIYTSAPRWVFEMRVEREQYVASWEATRYAMSDADGFKKGPPPDEFFMFRYLIAKHESPDVRSGQPKCCQRAWEPNRLRCWGDYRSPNDNDLELVSQAVQVRERERFLDPYQPLSLADLMAIEAMSGIQMEKMAEQEMAQQIAIGRDFDKLHGWRLREDDPSTRDRFFDQSPIIQP